MNNKRSSIAAPPVALHAASQPLAITVNLDEPFPATVALHLATLLDDPRLLPERDELARSALHCFLECANSRRIIRNQRHSCGDGDAWGHFWSALEQDCIDLVS